MISVRKLAFVSLISISGCMANGQAEDPAIVSMHDDALITLYNDDCASAIQDFMILRNLSTTSTYRASSSSKLVFSYHKCGQHQSAIDAANQFALTADAALPGLLHWSSDSVRYKADSQRVLGNIASAILSRAELIDDWKDNQFLVSDYIVDLYVENALDEYSQGRFAEARSWYDRLLNENTSYGVDPSLGLTSERREFDRIAALSKCGFSDNSPEYGARARSLAGDPGMESGRATPWLLYEHLRVQSLQGDHGAALSIAAEAHAGSLAYDWHLVHDRQDDYRRKSERMTEVSRGALLAILITGAYHVPEDNDELYNRYLWSNMIVQHMSDMPKAQPFILELRGFVKEYVLSYQGPTLPE